MDKTWVEISRSALRNNVAALKHHVGQAKLMAVVKANAYGHGLPQVVRTLKSAPAVSWFGVDSLDEALIVRRSGARQPVLILGYVPPARLKEAVMNGFSLVVYATDTVKRLGAIATAKRPAKIHLKIETGTSRQGIWPVDLPLFSKIVHGQKNVLIEGVSTHYANIEDTVDPTYAMGQLRKFNEAVAVLEARGLRPVIRHTAASAAALLYPVTRFELIRAGIALYGLWPSENTKKVVLANGGPELTPVLSWKTTVAQVKRIAKGTPVSYGLTERVSRDSVVAVLPIGYWDGLDRSLSSKGSVLINGRTAKILGRVCMNMVVVDVTDCGRVRTESPVAVIGRQGRAEATAEMMAAAAGTINYETVTRINPFIERILVD